MGMLKDVACNVLSTSSRFVYDQSVALVRRLSLTAVVVIVALICVVLFFRKKSSLVTVSKTLLDDLSVQINKSIVRQQQQQQQQQSLLGKNIRTNRKVGNRSRSSTPRDRVNSTSHSKSRSKSPSLSSAEDDDNNNAMHGRNELTVETTDDVSTIDESTSREDVSTTIRAAFAEPPIVDSLESDSDVELYVQVRAPNRKSESETREEFCAIGPDQVKLEHRRQPRIPTRRRTTRKEPRQLSPEILETLPAYDALRLKSRGTRSSVNRVSHVEQTPVLHQLPLYAAPSNRRTSPGEEFVRQALEKIFGKPFPTKRPAFLRNPETGSNLELDCFNEELGIAAEYQGSQHYEFPNNYHATYKQFTDQLYRDDVKKKMCEDAGVYLIRVPYNVPYQHIEKYVRDRIPESLLETCV